MIGELLQTAPHHIQAQCLTAVVVDLDDFKRVNDTYGHAAGDRALVEISHRLREAVTPGAVLARTGGEEFLVVDLLMHESIAAEAVAANRLRRPGSDIRVQTADDSVRGETS